MQTKKGFEMENDFSWFNQNKSLSQKLVFMHQILSARYRHLDHISVVIHDPQTDYLRTFLDSSRHDSALTNYQTKLENAPQLQNILATGKSRVVNNLNVYSESNKEHTRRIIEAGYQSSYTMPMVYENAFYGFVFFNSCQINCFEPDVVSHIDPFGLLLSLIVICEIRSIRKLSAATRTVRQITTSRDFETGAHLERMSRYSRVIAQGIADSNNLSDEYIENLFLFSPLHDIGKITIADRILLKPDKLSDDEYEIMKDHTVKGLEIIDFMLSEFELERLAYVSILRNIVLHHHESMDGSGYPAGLIGENIPLEARIVATADIFDALTSKRPYKQAWSNETTFDYMLSIAGAKLDEGCVTSLINNSIEVSTLQEQFQESSL